MYTPIEIETLFTKWYTVLYIERQIVIYKEISSISHAH
jgi:hypothetical protein